MSEYFRGLTGRVAAPASGDEIRPVVSLFADVVGSTRLGERLSAAEVKTLIGECVTRMCEAVEAFGGEVRSYMGDGIAGFFGIDHAHPDDAERAVRAALEIQRVVAEYALDVRETWGIADFGVRVGLNSGRVAVGRVGASDPLRVALGDSVNVAARLQSAAQPGSIVLGGPVAAVVGDRFVLRPLGSVVIRGRDGLVEAFEVESELAQRVLYERTRMIGRSRELEDLTDAISQLCAGRGQVIAISGDAGIGKSRLLREARSRSPSEVVWLEGTCDSLDRRLPHAPFAQAVRAWLGIDAHTSNIEARLRLRSMALDLLAERFDDCAPYLARLIGIELRTRLDRRLEGLPADVLTSGLARALSVWLTQLAQRSPVVLAIDNFDDASRSTIELTKDLLAATEVAPVMIMLSRRAGASSDAEALDAHALTTLGSRVHTLRLAPLTEDESRLLIRELGGAETLIGGLVDLVAERAEGNPLYIEELFAAVGGAPQLVEKDSRIPTALQSVLLARLDALPPLARATAQVAAVQGRVFYHDVVCALEGAASAEGIGLLLRADLIREHSRSPRAYAFRHGLIRDAALSTLTEARHRELSRCVAEALRGWTGFEMERDVPALVSYFLICHQVDAALEHVEHLASRLVLVCRWRDAADLLEQYIREAERLRDGRSTCGRVRLRLASIWSALGRFDEAIAEFDRALPLVRIGEREDAQLTMARCLVDGGRVDEAERLLDALGLEGLTSVGEARVAILQGELALGRSDYAAAAEHVTALGDIKALPPAVAFEGASLAAGVLAFTRDVEAAEAWALYAQDVANRLGQLTSQLAARRRLALIYHLKGWLDEATRLTEDVHAQHLALGWVTGSLYSGLNLVHILLVQGRLRDAASLGADLLSRQVGGIWERLIRANLAAVSVEQGRWAEARAHARCALEREQELPLWARWNARFVLATVALRADADPGMVSTLLVELASIEEEFPDGDRCNSIANRSELALRIGDAGQALALANEARRLSVTCEPAVRLGVDRQIAVVGGTKDSSSAIGLLIDALARARQLGCPLEEGRILVALGELDAAMRETHFASAARIFASVGSELGLVELEFARAGALMLTF